MTTPAQVPSVASLLMGGGVPAAKFLAIGASVSGQIVEEPTVSQQTEFGTGQGKFWSDGRPMWQIVVTLATNERDPEDPEDDGSRRVYVRGQMMKAVSNAIKAAGAKGLEVGGVLAVTYSGNGQSKQAGFNAPKNYTAAYTPAVAAVLAAPPQTAAPVAQPAAPVMQAVPQADPAVQALQAQIAALQAQQAAAVPAQPVGNPAQVPF